MTPTENEVSDLIVRLTDRVNDGIDRLAATLSETTLDTEKRLAAVDEELKAKASAADLAEVKGQVSTVPTPVQLLALVVGIFVTVGLIMAGVRS
jgi:hypothetical protein